MFERIVFKTQKWQTYADISPLFSPAEQSVQCFEKRLFGCLARQFRWSGCRNRFWPNVRNTLLYEPVFDTDHHRKGWGDTKNNNMARQDLADCFLQRHSGT